MAKEKENVEDVEEELEPGFVSCGASKEVNGEELEAVVVLKVGDDIDEMVALFGPDHVFGLAIRSIKIKAQSQIRTYLVAGLDSAAIDKEFEGWRPDTVASRSRDPETEALRQFNRMDDRDAKMALLKRLQAELGA